LRMARGHTGPTRTVPSVPRCIWGSSGERYGAAPFVVARGDEKGVRHRATLSRSARDGVLGADSLSASNAEDHWRSAVAKLSSAAGKDRKRPAGDSQRCKCVCFRRSALRIQRKEKAMGNKVFLLTLSLPKSQNCSVHQTNSTSGVCCGLNYSLLGSYRQNVQK
jgi:hypothetical protein